LTTVFSNGIAAIYRSYDLMKLKIKTLDEEIALDKKICSQKYACICA
jgi:hypothetical protein